MAYIGNQVSSVPFIIDTFSGTGSATVFGQLTRAPASVASIAVYISGVYKTPGVDYTLNGDMILFTTPPGAGTNNIVIHHMGNGSATSVPSDGSVTGAKLAANTVRGNNIVAGTITGNLIGVGAISANHHALGSITGNLIGIGAVSGNQIGTGAISGNNIGIRAISGNNIGTGAISANNFAGGGITSNVLASNLSISVSQITEKINISGSSGFYGGSGIGTITGNLNIDIMNATVHSFESNTTSNVTFNLRGNTINTFDSCISVGNSISVVIVLKHNSSGGRAQTNVHIDGGLITNGGTGWAGNLIMYTANASGSGVKPLYQTITKEEYNMYSLTVFKRAANTYTVFLSNTVFERG